MNKTNKSRVALIVGGIAVIGLLAIAGVLLGAQLFLKSSLDDSKVSQARVDISRLEGKVEEYYAFHSAWPPDLTALTTPPGGGPACPEALSHGSLGIPVCPPEGREDDGSHQLWPRRGQRDRR
jgi:hypothetical protein